MRNDLRKANIKATEATAFHQKCVGTCEILRMHLEELAGFLQSILSTGKTNIDAEQRRNINKAINRSLDISKNFNTTMNDSSILYDETFSMNYSIQSISEFISESPANESVLRICASQNQLNELQKKIIKHLQTELIYLKNESKKKKLKNAKDRCNIPTQQTNNSESESWSEPDRNVSLARIGIDIEKSLITGNETTTDSENKENTDIKTRNSIKRLEEIILEKENQILTIQCSLVESDNNLTREKIKFAEIMKQNDFIISEQNNKIEKLSENIISLEKCVKNYEHSKIDLRVANNKLNNINSDIEDLKNRHKKEISYLEEEYSKGELAQIELKDYYDKLLKTKDRELRENYIPKHEFENLEKELEDLTCKLNIAYDKLNDTQDLKEKLKLMETQQRKLSKTIDDATLQSSKFIIERTKALNERTALESQIQELQSEIINLKTINSKKHSPESDEYINSSSDLGIESNVAAKTTSVEFTNLERSMLRVVEIDSVNIDIQLPHDCVRTEKEIIELKKKLSKTKRALEDTWSQLKHANKVKEKIEKDIQHQLLKTQNVLRNTRSSMEDAHNIESKNILQSYPYNKEMTLISEEKEN